MERHDGHVFRVCFRHPSENIKRQLNTQATRRIRSPGSDLKTKERIYSRTEPVNIDIKGWETK